MSRISQYFLGLQPRFLLGMVFFLITPGVLQPRPATALMRLDFEQKFFVHPGQQVWDFSLVRTDSMYHIFYHSIPDDTPHSSLGDTISHATSPDLKHWALYGPVLAVGQPTWESGATWAPDVFWEDNLQRWAMAYTACDPNMNQRIAFAYSPDLFSWTKEIANPVIEPDTTQYIWSSTSSWSDFRDPFIWQEQDTWHILVTARKYYTSSRGVLFHATSLDLLNWTDLGPMFVNYGTDPWRVLESPQYRCLGDFHHLFFGEYDTGGISLVSNLDPTAWDMADRVMIEAGSYAPELNTFDPGIQIFSRITPFILPQSNDLTYVARFDTLLTDPNGDNPQIFKPNPLAENWASFTGISFNANPTFGDNPLWRGETSVGMVGNGYFSSKEYYQGPLSSRGAPGVALGDSPQGHMDSKPFTITGQRMDLLVGGGQYPETCYVALLTAADSTLLYKESGYDDELMTPRTWDLRPYLGVECFVRIVDFESGTFGHLNVDEIIEAPYDLSAVPDSRTSSLIKTHGASPNPFNPVTNISFVLSTPGPTQLHILDLRGHNLWSSPELAGNPGTNTIVWAGKDYTGQPVPSGTYLYLIETQGTPAAVGKISLIK